MLLPRGLTYLLRWKSLGGSEAVAQDGVGKTKSLESHKEFIRASHVPGASLEKENKSAPGDHCTPSLSPLWFPLAQRTGCHLAVSPSDAGGLLLLLIVRARAPSGHRSWPEQAGCSWEFIRHCSHLQICLFAEVTCTRCKISNNTAS